MVAGLAVVCSVAAAPTPALAQTCQPGDRIWRITSDEAGAASAYGAWDKFQLCSFVTEKLAKNDLPAARLPLKKLITKVGGSGVIQAPNGETCDAYPFFWMARILFGQGKYDDARNCLEQEKTQGKIQQSRLRADFLQVEESVAALAGAERLAQLADKVLGWKAGAEGVVLSGKADTSQIERDLQRCRRFTSLNESKAAIQDLRSSLQTFFSTELEEKRKELARMQGDEKACSLTTFDEAKAEQVMLACVSQIARVGAESRNQGCRRFDELARTLAARRSSVTGWPCGAERPAWEALPTAPPVCASQQAKPTPADLNAISEGQRKLDQLIKDADDKLAALRGKLNADLKSAAARFEPPDVGKLAWAPGAAEKLAELRALKAQGEKGAPADQSPAPELCQIAQTLDSKRAEFYAILERGAANMLQECKDCAGLDQAPLNQLKQTLDAFRGAKSDANAKDLVQRAQSARDAMDRWYGANVKAFEKQLGDQRDLVAAANRWRSAAAPCLPASDALACLGNSYAGLMRQLAAPRSGKAWVDKSREVLDGAKTCLGVYDEQARRWPAVVEALRQRIGGLPALSNPPPEIRGEVERLDRLKKDAAGVFADPAVKAVAVESAGAEAAATPERIQRAQRDVDAATKLAPLCGESAALQGRLGWLRAYLVLSPAFQALYDGDVDRGIRAVRAGLSDEGLTDHDRAWAHATLSLLLYAKAKGTVGEVGQRLVEEAGEEAQQAHRLAARLELPDSLFPSAFRREVFERQR